MRAPLAPPRLSEPRNVDAEAQAVETSWDTDRREARIFAFSAWTVAVRFNSHNRNSNDPVGTSHSCQYRKSPATHPGPGASTMTCPRFTGLRPWQVRLLTERSCWG